MPLIETTRYDSPLGELILGAFSGKLCLCDWTRSRRAQSNQHKISVRLNSALTESITPLLQESIRQLNEYFAGMRAEFSIPLLFTGTDFQCRVWAELLKIPYGLTVTYTDIARSIGNPKAVRAVASAIAANPISILVPCHRVVGSNNKLTGYAGGLKTKHGLLNLEAHVCKESVLTGCGFL